MPESPIGRVFIPSGTVPYDPCPGSPTFVEGGQLYATVAAAGVDQGSLVSPRFLIPLGLWFPISVHNWNREGTQTYRLYQWRSPAIADSGVPLPLQLPSHSTHMPPYTTSHVVHPVHDAPLQLPLSHLSAHIPPRPYSAASIVSRHLLSSLVPPQPLPSLRCMNTWLEMLCPLPLVRPRLLIIPPLLLDTGSPHTFIL